MKNDIKNRNSISSSEFADEILWFKKMIRKRHFDDSNFRISYDIVFRWDDRLIIDKEKM